MEYTRLGKSGLKVSRITLGCMSYGDASLGSHPWALTEEQGRPFYRRALDLGINFFDTANIYSKGTSESILGRALRDFVPRAEVVIATKLHHPMRPDDPNGRGLSRKAIMTEIDASLKRLDTEYIDLYQIHRWDDTTPIEETMEALHDVVKAGKALYIGASSMHAWQFCKAQHVADSNGWTRFVSMQPHYNLIYREEEREMLPFCQSEGVGVIPWSPLARGRLAKPWLAGTSKRQETDAFAKALYQKTEEADGRVVGVLSQIAKEHGVSQSQIALAWLHHKSAVTSPIVGATKMEHLEDAVASVKIKLSAEEMTRLEAHYVPHEVAGFS